MVAWLVATQRTTAASAGLALVALSPAAWLGLERANNDLVIFVLVALAVLVPWRHRAILLAASSVLKVYPLVAVMAKAVRERTVLNAVLAVLVIAYLAGIYDDLMQISRATPAADFLSFGIKTMVDLFAEGPIQMSAEGVYAIFAAGTIVAIGCAVMFPHRDKLTPLEEESALIAGVLLLFCYVAISNWDYRLIFTLLMVPYFLRPASRGERGFGWIAVTIVLLSGSYWFLGRKFEADVIINTAAKYLLYCILVFSVTRIVLQSEDIRSRVAKWRARA